MSHVTMTMTLSGVFAICRLGLLMVSWSVKFEPYSSTR